MRGISAVSILLEFVGYCLSILLHRQEHTSDRQSVRAGVLLPTEHTTTTIGTCCTAWNAVHHKELETVQRSLEYHLDVPTLPCPQRIRPYTIEVPSAKSSCDVLAPVVVKT
ncbi:hypothetical protein H257_18883, partial [Aphanomyces astaci]